MKALMVKQKNSVREKFLEYQLFFFFQPPFTYDNIFFFIMDSEKSARK